MTRLEGIAFNALSDALADMDRWLTLTERQQVASAVLAAVVPEVREQVAKDIEETVAKQPRPRVGRGEFLNDVAWAARIARGEP